MRSVLSIDDATAILGPFSLINNTWNIGTLVNGQDFTQTISYDPNDLAHDVRITWAYDSNQNPVLAYPELQLGFKPWGQQGSTALVTAISSLRNLDLTFDISISGQTDGFNVAYDLWLTDEPAGGPETITTELMIWLHSGAFTPAGTVVATYHGADFTAKVWQADNFSAAPGVDWRYLAVDIDTEKLTGSIDLDGLLRFLADRGIVSASDYLTGVELGAEITKGTGAMTIHSFGYDFSKYHITNGADILSGTAQNDVINALAGADRAFGGAGNDRLVGDLGNDTLYGGSGGDTLHGGAGADSLLGGAGADVLTGAAGIDRLSGGAGADIFAFRTTADSGRTLATSDLIEDFSTRQYDKVDLTRIDANSLVAGNQAFHFIGAQGFGGHAGDLRTVHLGGKTVVIADTNGDRLADFAIAIEGSIALTETLFLL